MVISTIVSRIKEHYQNGETDGLFTLILITQNKPSMQDISREVLPRNIHDIRTCKIIETLEIRKHDVMNGCVGRTLNLD